MYINHGKILFYLGHIGRPGAGLGAIGQSYSTRFAVIGVIVVAPRSGAGGSSGGIARYGGVKSGEKPNGTPDFFAGMALGGFANFLPDRTRNGQKNALNGKIQVRLGGIRRCLGGKMIFEKCEAAIF